MASLDLTTYAYAAKTLWPEKRVNDTTLKNHPFLAMVPKDKAFYGKNLVLAVKHANSPGRSATFSKAQSNKGYHRGVAFTITRNHDYSLASIDGETIEATANDAGALAAAMDTEYEAAFMSATSSLATALYRDGAGDIGKIATGGVSGGVITLATPQDVINFYPGMKFTANPTRTGTVGDMRDSAAAGTVTVVNYDAGTVTYSGTITGIAAADFLYQEGDYDGKLKGLAAWFPTAAPVLSSDSFFGVDRGANPSLLAGMRLDISSYMLDEGLKHAAQRLYRQGGTPDFLFINPDQWTSLDNRLAGKVEYQDLAKGEIMFRAIIINGPSGPIKVMSDPDCPANLGYMLTMNTLKLYSLGSAPKILGLDNLKMLRESAADGYEQRIGYYAQLGCDAPGKNAVLTLPNVNS